MTAGSVTLARGSLLERVNAVVRRIIGAPDYTAYLRHVASHHPECEPLTEAEFLDEQLTARYSTPGSRCC
jgi:uncharacterized short protein YbdD (DUF466 family)